MTEINQKAWKYIYERTMAENDYSKRVAISDGRRKYTYRQFFDNCKRYASVFSALGMTRSNKSRVGVLGTGAAETIISFYGLNMTGAEISLMAAYSAFKTERIIQVIKDEHLTDLILTDDYIQESALRKIVSKKDELGLRFIIMLHPPVCGCTVPALLSAFLEQKSAMTRAIWGPLYMDFLLNVYGHWPVSYDENGSNDSAVIIHTSGTTGGNGNPVVMSDRALNSMCRSIAHIDGYEELKEAPVTGLMVELSSAYGIIEQVHFPLSLGGKIGIIPGNMLNPWFYRSIPQYKVTLLLCNSILFDMWMKYPESAGFDFSSLRMVVLGGMSVSADDKKRYREFIMKHGGNDIPILNGYGLSEMGGLCALSSEDINDESVGRLLDGFEARFFDEETEKYLKIEDAPLNGVLYLHSDTMSSRFLDGKQTVKSEEIDGKDFICTNDLMSVDSTGKLTYLGRANRYFVHNDGIKYQSGRVETEISRQPGIENCGIVPAFDRVIHESVPMLCLTTVGDTDSLETARKALVSVFVKDKILPEDNVPSILMIAEKFPRNANGKIDLFKLNKGEVEGIKYSIVCKRKNGDVVDFSFEEMQNGDDNIMHGLYKEIAKDIMGESVLGQLKKKKTPDMFKKFAATGPVQSAKTMYSINRIYYNTMICWMYQMWNKYKNSNYQ